jgi:hypothetical protein
VTTFPVFSASDPSQAAAGLGSKDGRGSGDHDQPYTFGRRPRASAPFPFRAHEYGRLLALRGCVADGLLGADDLDAVGLDLASPTGTAESDRDRVARALLFTAGVLV